MQYVSTRNNTELYTAYRALHEKRAPDGGFFVPYRLQVFTAAELSEISQMTFGERVSRILNIFFPVGLNGWDIDFSIGRHPFRLVQMNHKLYIAELWHNLVSDYRYIEDALFAKLCENDTCITTLTTWPKIAIRIAILFGLYGEIVEKGIETTDFAGLTGDYSSIVATWYAKRMGLPIGNIICVGDEYSGVWDFFHKGELSFSDIVKDGNLPLLDITDLEFLEILIYEAFGPEEVKEYLAASAIKGFYRLNEEALPCLNQTMSGVVVSRIRCTNLIRSIYRTHDYLPDPYTAVVYGALQDYRSSTGESCTTLIVSDISPKIFETMICKATGVLPDEMRRIICNN